MAHHGKTWAQFASRKLARRFGQAQLVGTTQLRKSGRERNAAFMRQNWNGAWTRSFLGLVEAAA
jgi:hypothetical protein